ncbi:tetratricopeptide repeat protein, partial [candidate division KSB1 bacterium]|nr:tetratricopeptide repeat protein [candidate division KSB1 bacterium]
TLKLITMVEVEKSEIFDFSMQLQIQEIRKRITEAQLKTDATQSQSIDLKEDQIAEWLNKGRALKESEELRPEAIKIFTKIIEKFPKQASTDEVRYELGACYYLSNEDSVDIALYFKRLRVMSDTLAAKICYMLARYYRDHLLPELAEYYYQKVVGKYPHSRFADDALLILAYDEKDYLRSIPKYQKIVQNYPQGDKAGDAAYKVGELYYRTEQYERAAQAWKNYLANYATISYLKESAFDYLFNSYQRLKLYPEIEALLQNMLREKAESAYGLVGRLARIYYFDVKDKSKAQAVLKLVPRNDWDSEFIALESLFKNENFNHYLVSKYPSKDPEEISTKLVTPQDYYDQAEKMNYIAPAYNLLTQALRLNPVEPLLSKIEYRRGRLLLEAAEYWEAKKILTSSQIQDPEFKAFSQYNLGLNYAEIGAPEQMRIVLTDFYQTHQQHFLGDDALINLATLDYRPECIKSYLRKIISSFPNGDMTPEAADWLARIYLYVDRNYDSTLYVIDQEFSANPHISVIDFQWQKNNGRFRKGINFIVSHQFLQAENYFRGLYSSDQEHALEGLFELSEFLQFEVNDLKGAEKVLLTATRLAPDLLKIKERIKILKLENSDL